MNEYIRRIRNVERIMTKWGIDCLLINRTESIKYLTGANNRCSWVFLTNEGRQIALVLDSDYGNYKKQSIIEDIRFFRTNDPFRHFKEVPKELKLKNNSMAIEKQHLRFVQFQMIEKFFRPIINLDIDADVVLEEARIIKTPDEIENIKGASELAIIGMQIAEKIVNRVTTEIELANRIHSELLKEGASGDTYIYVGSDDRSGLAHTPPTINTINKGPVVVDIHASYHGYHSDMARTIFLANNDSEEKKIYDYFKEKVNKGINNCMPGATLAQIQKFFYKGLKLKEGLNFLVGPLLHGVGIINFELPKFEYPFQSKGYPEKIKENMVLAFSNIGIYSKDNWGIRFEDTFIATEDQPIILTKETSKN